MTATIRPGDWNVALFVHVLGAMVLVGGVVLALVYLAAAWRGRSPDAFRAGFRALLYGAIPGYLVMRGAAQWIYSKEGLDKAATDPSWIGIGFGVADFGLLLLIIATATAGVASRRAVAGGDGADAAPRVLGIRISAGLCALLLVMYLIAIWAMTTKPG
ncbi:MAG: hypothetical protein QOI10_160 [Solirubrobacterales bacterium]|nr:hypothetical protein [Solirubrobacterales bacterium]